MGLILLNSFASGFIFNSFEVINYLIKMVKGGLIFIDELLLELNELMISIAVFNIEYKLLIT